MLCGLILGLLLTGANGCTESYCADAKDVLATIGKALKAATDVRDTLCPTGIDRSTECVKAVEKLLRIQTAFTKAERVHAIICQSPTEKHGLAVDTMTAKEARGELAKLLEEFPAH